MGANVNAKNKSGESPLNLSIKHQYKSVILLLIERGAVFDVRDGDPKMMVDDIVQKKDLRSVKDL